MRLLFSSALLAMVASTSALADTSEVKRGPQPKWVSQSDLLSVPENPEGLAFFRRQDVLVHMDGEGQTQYTGYRVRILHPKALEMGNIVITWNPASGRPTVHAIKVYRGDEVIDVLKTASFEILRREDQLEQARLDGNLTAVLRVADLRVGDELEVGVTIPENDPTLMKDVAGVLYIQQEPGPGRFHLGLSWNGDRKPDIKMTPDMEAFARNSPGATDFVFDNPPVVSPPKDAPPRFEWQRAVEYSQFPGWTEVSRKFAPIFARAARLSDSSPLKQEAQRIATANPDPFARAQAALKLVQQDVRYIYVGLNGGNLTPATADETWQRRYGDCKGKTVLLMALLAELGVKAEAVLVNGTGSDDGFDQRLPNPNLFNHVLVRAEIAGKQFWLDGTLPPVAQASADPVMPYHWVLPLTEPGSSIVHLPWKPATSPEQITLFEIDARAGFDQPAHVEVTSIIRGIDGLTQQMQFSGISQAQLLSVFRQKAVGDTWQSIDDVRWHYDAKARASVLKISGIGKIDWEKDGDGRSLALPGGGFNPPDKRVRSSEQDQNLPYYNKAEYSCHVTTVRLPASTKASQWSSKPGFDTHIFGKNYYRAFDLRDNAIRMVRGFRVEKQEITAANARKDNDRIPAFDNSMAYIFYDPAGQAVPLVGKEIVPTTYDFDWTAESVPCLSHEAALNTAM